MKALLTIDWNDYYLEATPAELAALNTALSKCVKVAGHVDTHGGKMQKAMLTEEGLRHGIRLLSDNCTTIQPSAAEEMPE